MALLGVPHLLGPGRDITQITKNHRIWEEQRYKYLHSVISYNKEIINFRRCDTSAAIGSLLDQFVTNYSNIYNSAHNWCHK
jgi:hypothetical protein